MRNKIIAFFLAMMLVVTCIPSLSVETAYAATPEITISGAEAQPGDSVDLTVAITGNPGITSIDFNVNYDASQFTLTNKQNGKLLGGTMNSQTLDKVPYYCGWINSLQKTNCTEDGILITLTFKVKDGAVNGKHPISFTKGIVTGYDADIKAVDFAGRDGYIEVKNGKEPDKPGNPSNGTGGGGTVDLPAEPDNTAKPDDSVKPDSGEEQAPNETPDESLTQTQKKTIEAIERMKIAYTSAKYNKTKKTYSLKFKKTNKSYRLDGYQIYRSTKANKGFKKIASTSKTTWTDKKPGKKGSIKYYKVRGFRKVAGKTYYTEWSSVKKLVVR